jgi:hypothetical protein
MNNAEEKLSIQTDACISRTIWARWHFATYSFS